MRTGYECVMSVPDDMHIVMVQGICEWDARVVPWNKIKMMLALHANNDAKTFKNRTSVESF